MCDREEYTRREAEKRRSGEAEKWRSGEAEHLELFLCANIGLAKATL
jgi:hypothetical protein